MTLGGAFLRSQGRFTLPDFGAGKHRVAHAVEPLDFPCLRITVTLRTDIFDRARMSAPHQPSTAYVYDPRLRDIVNRAAARFLSERQPRMPNLTEVIQAATAI